MCKIRIAWRLVVDIFLWCNANFVPFPSGMLVGTPNRKQENYEQTPSVSGFGVRIVNEWNDLPATTVHVCAKTMNHLRNAVDKALKKKYNLNKFHAVI